MDFGRDLLTRVVVKPGNVAKKPLSMASFQVRRAGLQQARWGYLIKLGLVRMWYTLMATWSLQSVSVGVIGASHSLELWSRSAVRTTWLLLSVTVASSFRNHASYPASQNCPTDSRDL